MSNPAVWLDKPAYLDDSISPADLDEIEAIVDNCMWEIMHPLIGVILPYATNDPPSGTLACDGGVYLRENYPELYAQLDDAFIIDDDSFFTPDLRGKVVIGMSSDHAVGDEGGAETVTLDVSEIPAHSHTSPPHAHSEIGAVATLINGGLEAPASAATAFSTTTGLASATIDNTGGGEAHNNMQPFLTLKYCIGAG